MSKILRNGIGLLPFPLLRLLPKLSKIPPKVSLAVIGASVLVSYVSTLQPAIADPGEWLRSTINQAASNTGITPKAVPVPSQPAPIGNSQYSDCVPPAPQQVNQSVSVQPATRPVGSYWAQNITPTDDRAKIILNLAPGTTRKAVSSRVGMGTNDNGSNPRYDTSDGLIEVTYQISGSNSLSDRVKSVRIVR